MTDREIARERARKQAEAETLSTETPEIEGLGKFYRRTGGVEAWRERWGYYTNSPDMASYTGVRLDNEGHVQDLMLSDNGLSSLPALNSDGVDYGEGLNHLRYLQSLNIRSNRLEGSLEKVFDSACALTRADQFSKRTIHFHNLRSKCAQQFSLVARWLSHCRTRVTTSRSLASLLLSKRNCGITS